MVRSEEVPVAVGGARRLEGTDQGGGQPGQPAGPVPVCFIWSTDQRAVIAEGKQHCFSLGLLVALMSVDRFSSKYMQLDL